LWKAVPVIFEDSFPSGLGHLWSNCLRFTCDLGRYINLSCNVLYCVITVEEAEMYPRAYKVIYVPKLHLAADAQSVAS